jgi:hypothetical protein
MAGPFNFTNESQIFKILFADGLVQPLSQKESIFRMRLSNTDSWGGQEVRSVPMRYALPQARSRLASQALNKRFTANAPMAQWIMRPGYDYASFRIQYGDILRARDDRMAFARLQQLAVTSTIETLNRSINTTLWRDGSGFFGVVATTQTTSAAGGAIPSGGLGAIALTNAADAYSFDPGMELQFFNTITNNIPNVLNGGQTVTVVAVDAEAGYVYIDTVPATITGLVSGTFIIMAGDGVGFGPTLENGAIAGVASYIPVTVPVSGTTLWGQDQSVWPQKLAGFRKDARGLNVLEEVQRMTARIHRLGGRPSAVYASPEQVQNMIIGRDVLTENFREVKRFSGDDGFGGEMVQEVGYSGIRIQTPAGTLALFSEPFCPPDRVYVLDESTWHLDTMGQFPHLVQMGTMNGLLQEQDDFALQGRLFASGQFWCDAPAFNGVLQVTPVF